MRGRRETGTKSELLFCQSIFCQSYRSKPPAKRRSALFFSSIQEKWRAETGNLAGGIRDRAPPRSQAGYLCKHRIF